MEDIGYADSWISQPDVCRCCLSTSGTWDVTCSYVTEAGDKEVYSEMLQDCYGITLSHLLQFGPSRMVCALCVGHLRDALNFRNRVTLAEQQFVAYIGSRQRTFNPVVVNLQPEAKEESSASDSNDDGTIDVLTVPTERPLVDRMKRPYIPKPKTKSKSKSKPKPKPKRKRQESESKDLDSDTRKRQESKSIDLDSDTRKRQESESVDLDSDTPISEISRKNNVSKSVAETAGSDSMDLESVDSMEVLRKSFNYARPQNGVKQVSERKRIMLTCDTVLRDTTACPFRHHKSWFQCFFCQESFMDINLLRDHTKSNHSNIDDEIKKIKRYPRSLQIEISKLECRVCSLNLTDVSTMRRHLLDVHKKVVYTECIADYKVNGTPYSCHLCGQQFHVFRSLTIHLNEHYANCICDVCGKSFMNSKRLKVHKRTHENGQFPCSECGKILKTKTSKANHMESAHSKRVIKCQICLKPMKHYNDRIKHMSEVHNITHNFKCPICSREYNIKHYLATHIRQTHGHKNKRCMECGMAFITNHELKKHMFKHTGLKPFSCSICCKSYTRSYSLREHMRVHSGVKILEPQ